jgi:hypothetical protein
VTPQSKCLNCGCTFTRYANHRTGAYCSGACQRAHAQRGLPPTVRVVDTPPDEPTPPHSLNRKHGTDNRE